MPPKICAMLFIKKGSSLFVFCWVSFKLVFVRNIFTFQKINILSLISYSHENLPTYPIAFNMTLREGRMKNCVLVVSALRSGRSPVRVQLPATCRGELSAVIARLMAKCL